MGVLAYIIDRLCIERFWSLKLVCTVLILVPSSSFAAKWTIEPSIQVQETYSDNVALTEEGEEDFVSELNPAITMIGKGNRLQVNLGYAMQNLFYAEDDNRNSTNHTLGADASAELIEDFGFLDTKVALFQVVVSPSEGLPLDNLNESNRTDVATFSVSPYLKHRFGRVMEASARYRYETVRYDEGASDSDIEAVGMSLQNGSAFQRTSWLLNYSRETTIRELAGDIESETSQGDLAYRLDKYVSMLFRAGIEQHDLATLDESGFENGSYWAAGFRVTPSRKMSIDLLYGNRLSSVALRWSPTSRTAMDIEWREQTVGLNPGTIWSGKFRLGNRRTIWQASYLEDTTSIQNLQITNSAASDSASSNPVITDNLNLNSAASDSTSSSIGDPSALNPTLGTAFELSDDLFVRKRAEFGMEYRSAKSRVGIVFYNERREFISVDDEEKVRGGVFLLDWRVAVRTNLLFGIVKLRTDYRAGFGEGRLLSRGLKLTRKMGRGLEGAVIVRQTSQGGLVGGQSYRENRFSIGVKWKI